MPPKIESTTSAQAVTNTTDSTAAQKAAAARLKDLIFNYDCSGDDFEKYFALMIKENNFEEKPLGFWEKVMSFLQEMIEKEDDEKKAGFWSKLIKKENEIIEAKKEEVELSEAQEYDVDAILNDLTGQKIILGSEMENPELENDERLALESEYNQINKECSANRSTKISLGNRVYSLLMSIFMRTCDLGKLKFWDFINTKR